MNIILIVSDTFRRDHLDTYGDTSVHTPHLDALAESSVVFDRYYSASFPTMPARADYTTGKCAFTFMTWQPLPTKEIPLAQRLSENGYITVGVADTPFYTIGGMGYDRGYQHFYDMQSQETTFKKFHPPLMQKPKMVELDYCAPATFTMAEQCLERIHDRDKPFFMLVDTWDPHEPWDPPHWYVKPYLPDHDGRLIDPPYGYLKDHHVTPEDLDIGHGLYKAEITMVDRWVGRLLERVESLGIADDTAIIFTSDHGYYFGEHGIFGKMNRGGANSFNPGWLRSPLYEEVIHNPLFIRVPGAAPRRVSKLASAVDIVPTILDLAGVPVSDPSALHGHSLLPHVLGRDNAGAVHDIIVSGVPLINPGQPLAVVDNVMRSVEEYQPVTITSERWSLLYSAAGEPVELYDLEHDPKQANNVADDHPEVVRELHAKYVQFLKDCGTEPYLVDPRSSLG